MRPAILGTRAIRWSLRCYPAWWCARYGAEQKELAEDLASEGRRSWILAAGLLAGSVRARLTGSGMPPVPALWSSRARISVVASVIPAALALPAGFAFVGAVSERGWSDGAAATLSGAATVVRWELVIVFLMWFGCVVPLLAAGTHLAAKLLPLASHRRLRAAAFVAAPVAAVVLGAAMVVLSKSLRPVVSSWDKNLITGVTHYHYLRRGSPLAATALEWAGWIFVIGGWAVGLVALGRAVARRPLPARALEAAVFSARMTALTQGTFALSLIALQVTVAAQTPIGPRGGLIYASRLGPAAVPILVMLAAVAALSITGAANAQTAAARSGRLRSQPGPS